MPEIPFPDPPLGDGVVSLRGWRDSDVPPLVEALEDREISRWTAIPWPYGERDAREFLVAAEGERRAGRSIGLAAVAAANGQLLGSVGLNKVEWPNRKAEIGYWVGATSRRRSIGARAVRLVSRWALDQLGIERLELLANPENEPSQRLAERAGYTREGLLRSYRYRKGRREDLVMFSLLAEDL